MMCVYSVYKHTHTHTHARPHTHTHTHARPHTDALETLKQYHSRHGDSVSRDITDGYILSDVCGELVDACRKQAEPADVKALVSALFNYGYMKKGTYSILKQTILAYVEKLVCFS